MKPKKKTQPANTINQVNGNPLYCYEMEEYLVSYGQHQWYNSLKLSYVMQCATCSSTLYWKDWHSESVCMTTHLWEWISICPFEFLPSRLTFSRRCCQYFLWPQSTWVRHDSPLWKNSCRSSFSSSLVTGMMSPKWTSQLDAARRATGHSFCLSDWFGAQLIMSPLDISTWHC